MRTATAHLVAKVDGDNPDQIAKKNWPDDRDVGSADQGRGSASTTTTSAATILTTLTPDFIASLSPMSAGAALLALALQLRFDGAGTISVPAFIADAANSGFVHEGQPILFANYRSSCSASTVKLASIAVMTGEMVTCSVGNVQKMIEE